MKVTLICALFLSLVLCDVAPPQWPNRFQITFVESYSSTAVRVSGKYHYDHAKGFTRIDRINGKFDMVCGSITP